MGAALNAQHYRYLYLSSCYGGTDNAVSSPSTLSSSNGGAVWVMRSSRRGALGVLPSST
jgi:hypothetical protein